MKSVLPQFYCIYEYVMSYIIYIKVYLIGPFRSVVKFKSDYFHTESFLFDFASETCMWKSDAEKSADSIRLFCLSLFCCRLGIAGL